MKKGILIFIFALGLMIPLNSLSQTLNNKLAAIYVYNFTQYIEWPKNDKATEFVIGVYGNTPLTDELKKAVMGKHVDQKPIVVKVLKSLDEAGDCSILFIAPSEYSNLKKISDQFKGKHILLICDKEGLSKKGASISVYLDEDDDYKTKFELNKAYIEYNGLLISKSLLNMAAKVN
jgi:hypothetical protein